MEQPAKIKHTFGWLLLGCLAGVAVLFHFPPDQYRFYPRCLLHALTGLQCPGCGGLRAAHHLLHGEIASAFQLNPLLVLLLPVLALSLLAYLMNLYTGRDWLNPFRQPVGLWVLLGLFVAFGIVRNLPFDSLASFKF